MATVSAARILTARQRARYREWALAYLFVLPTIVGLALFVLGPILYSAAMSFTNWKIAGTPVFVGLENYQEMFRSDLFWRVVRPNRQQRAVRSGPWKLLADGAPNSTGADTHLMLFDLRNDPGERRDLAAVYPQRVRRLRALIDAWERDVGSR